MTPRLMQSVIRAPAGRVAGGGFNAIGATVQKSRDNHSFFSQERFMELSEAEKANIPLDGAVQMALYKT